MCYSLRATVSFFVLGLYEFAFATVWLLLRDEYSHLDRVAILTALGWIPPRSLNTPL